MRSDDLFERRTFVSLGAVFVAATDEFGAAAAAATVLDANRAVAIADDVVGCTVNDSACRFCSGPKFNNNIIWVRRNVM